MAASSASTPTNFTREAAKICRTIPPATHLPLLPHRPAPHSHVSRQDQQSGRPYPSISQCHPHLISSQRKLSAFNYLSHSRSSLTYNNARTERTLPHSHSRRRHRRPLRRSLHPPPLYFLPIPSRSIEIDVYEQASQYKEIGAGVGIGINAARLVHKLGLGDQLNAVAGRRSGVWITFRRFDDGGEIVTLPVKDDDVVRQAPCARSAFLELLKSAVEERGAAKLWTKKAAVGVKDQNDDTVLIQFADGTNASANLVLGADGIHSPIRAQFVPDKLTYSGQIAYRGVIPVSSLPKWPFESYSIAWLAKHKHFLVFPISSNRELNIVAFVTKSDSEVADVKESWVSKCDKSDVEEDFNDFESTVQDIIKLMPERPSKWRINDREPLDKWWYMGGKVTLLGDSAHSMLPHLGAGAGQAMEDGWVLGRAVSEYLPGSSSSHFASLRSTASLYQAARLPRAQKTQKTSRAAGNTYEFQTEDMRDLGFEECLPLMAERTKERMKWVWEEDLDACYEGVRDSGK